MTAKRADDREGLREQKMERERRIRLAAGLGTVLAVICLALIYIGLLYWSNEAKIRKVLETDRPRKGDAAQIEESIARYEELAQLKFVSAGSRAKLYTNLSMFYALKPDEARMIENAVRGSYLAQISGDSFYAAVNYINMSEVFKKLYDYDTAAELLDIALSLKIDDPEGDAWVKETAYMEMALLKQRDGKAEEARHWLGLSESCRNEAAYDYEEMLLRRKIILADIYMDEGDYGRVAAILSELPDLEWEGKDLAVIQSTVLPLLELKSRLAAAEGRLKESAGLCGQVLEMYGNYGLYAEEVRFLKEIVPLYEARDEELYACCCDKMADAYASVVRENGRLTSSYIFSIYGNEYTVYANSRARRIIAGAAVTVVLVILILSYLLILSRRLSCTDALTRINNRRYFDRVYGRFLEKGVKFTLLLVDVDHFKGVNDTYGHSFGDEVLYRLGREFVRNRTKDTSFFRVGGEEFCILYKGSDPSKAVAWMEKVRGCVERTAWENGAKITISAGAAFSPQDEDPYRLADERLYRSKEEGRNRVTWR